VGVRAAGIPAGSSLRPERTDTTVHTGNIVHCQEQVMARRRSSKETYAQKVVELATSTLPLPTPIKSVAKSRWGSRLLLVLVPILIASGVVTISWTGGLPSITVNKDRAVVVGQEVQQEAIKAAERVQQYRATNYR
jgi:hypothetical protein